jgi:hypothetical protein
VNDPQVNPAHGSRVVVDQTDSRHSARAIDSNFLIKLSTEREIIGLGPLAAIGVGFRNMPPHAERATAVQPRLPL